MNLTHKSLSLVLFSLYPHTTHNRNAAHKKRSFFSRVFPRDGNGGGRLALESGLWIDAYCHLAPGTGSPPPKSCSSCPQASPRRPQLYPSDPSARPVAWAAGPAAGEEAPGERRTTPGYGTPGCGIQGCEIRGCEIRGCGTRAWARRTPGAACAG